jgi:hypothetical protein
MLDEELFCIKKVETMIKEMLGYIDYKIIIRNFKEISKETYHHNDQKSDTVTIFERNGSYWFVSYIFNTPDFINGRGSCFIYLVNNFFHSKTIETMIKGFPGLNDRVIQIHDFFAISKETYDRNNK